MAASWYNADWEFRVAITIDNDGGGSGTNDVSLSLPGDFDHLWENTQSDGYDIRAVDADGRTDLTFEIDSWNQTNRTGTVEIDDYDHPAEGMCLIWLYYKKTQGDATNPWTSVTLSAAFTAHLEQGCPPPPGSGRVVKGILEQPGSSNPIQEVSKMADDSWYLWWDVTDMLASRCEASNGRQGYEGVDYIQFSVERASTPEAGLFEEDQSRFVELGGRMWVRTYIKGGTSGNDYTAILTIGTTDPAGGSQTFTARALIKVREVDET